MNKVIKLKAIAEVITGFPFKGEFYSSSGIRTVRGENITEGKLRWDTIKCWDENFEKIKEYSLKENDVVIGMDGSKVGKNKARIRKEDLPLLLAQRVACVRAKQDNCQLFLFYLINNPMFESYVYKTQTGSSVPHISKTQIEDFEIPQVNYVVQQKIASVLSALDDKIELNNKINAELEQMAKTIYDYWFVQFDFPNANGKPYKSSGGKMVWNGELKREVPEGWEVKKLGEEIDIQRGISYTGKEINGSGISMINLNSFNLDGTYKAGGLKKYSGNYSPKNIATPNDLLIAATDVTRNADIIGKAILVPSYYSDDLVFSMDIAKIIPKNIPCSFLMLLFNSEHYHNYIKYYATGTLVLHLNLDGVKRYETELPPKKLLDKFDTLYQKIAERIYKSTLQNQKLSQLRDWLLPMLMNGQVKVGKAYEKMEEVLSVAAEYEVPYDKTIQLSIPKNKQIFAKQVLAGKIVSLFKEDKNFTHIKFQKLQFLAEHIAQADLSLNYYFQSAGPYDNRFMHTIFDSFKKSKWFDKKGYHLIPLEKQGQIDGYYEQYFSPVADKFNKLFKLLENLKESTVEIIATVYAVWNNRIILKQEISEEQIVKDFYNWSDRKNRYTKDEIQEALQWLKVNEFEPIGFGKEIKRAKNK